MISNLNDGTQAAPYLRTDINLGTIGALPEWSAWKKLEGRELLVALKEAGYRGVQGGDPKLCRELGLGVTTGGRVKQKGEALELAKKSQDAGYECATVHAGTGFDSDEDINMLVEEILNASSRTGFPLYLETHRATVTQDVWRTVQMVKRFPEIRFNGDFSHWYTGHEFPYGDINAKFDFCEPVFERVRFMHGRIGSPGSMQVNVGDGAGLAHVDHFREMWTRCFRGFRKTARPGDFVVFAPELLGPPNYARLFPDGKGELKEESDRWEQGLVLTRIARECFG